MKVKQLDNGLIKVVLSIEQATHVKQVIGKQYSPGTDGQGVFWALDNLLEPSIWPVDSHGVVARKTSKGNITLDLTAKQYRWVYDRLGEELISEENGLIYDTMDQLDGTW